ncbi:NADPH-dependent oxidoreductase [Mycolicibacterium sp. P9-64]|uniref:NADPH-dependent FMN reductase n=1 Tax=Mycolicibacterium sp. P9-64 TaxID=2024612 RepID=UPI0011EFF496|nr:NAD(P)H-dependent oxidoreductase [Mycolicibacterium sp. P9-64]KAA0084598.1 NADPH-dependent oxidoreductase [Mycolicibacterium sp. P9-64]
MVKVTILCGNPKPRSRTLGVAEDVVSQLLQSGTHRTTIVDLAEHVDRIFEWPSDTMDELQKTVAGSDLLVVASPTYKATYTGLLKAFLDRFGSAGLSGTLAIPVMTGGDLRHAIGPDAYLRPLLVELGASVPTGSLYFVMSDIDVRAERIQEWIDRNADAIRGRSELRDAMAQNKS